MKWIYTIIALSVLALAACVPLECPAVPVCEECPEVPEEFEPLTTTIELQAYAGEMVYPCEGETMRFETTPITGPDEYEYYGYKGTTLIDGIPRIVSYIYVTECLSINTEATTDESGRVLYSFWVDPNNGWVKKLTCVDNEDCPENIPNQPNDLNPNYEAYLALI